MTSQVSDRLPEFPWDQLTTYAATARAHDDGIVDLSIGTPVDPTPAVAQDALAAAADSPGYPTTIGLPETRQAVVDWFARCHGVPGLGVDQVFPLIGSKEFISSLPTHLGLGPEDLVVYPELAYPTYLVGAALAGTRSLAADDVATIRSEAPRLVWVNSPANPTGRVLSPEHLAAVVVACREAGALLVSDECYIESCWGAEATSVLHPDVCGGSHDGVLVVHSLSKRSNLAGYRCGYVAGDRVVIAELLAVRKNLGLLMPGPQQRVMSAVLADDVHSKEQHGRYARRREILVASLQNAGFRIDHSEGSLYLWATRGAEGPDCWVTVAELAELGILVAPGAFYGTAGSHHVRVALTATDERIEAAAQRLRES